MSKNAPTHTFVIPAYKESSFLDDCIQSLLNQTVKSKIIIATSTPNDFITQIAERYNIPVKVNTGKAGIGLDWNFALSCCDTQYCTLAHQDDLYLPLYTEKMLKAMSRDHDSGIAFCDYSDLKAKGIKTWHLHLVIKRLILIPFYFKSRWKLSCLKKWILRFGCPICCPSVCFNVENLENFRFNQEYSINLDWDAWLRIATMDKSFIYIWKNLLQHRISPEAETNVGILENRRQAEDKKLFNLLWPRPIASLLAFCYSISYNNAE